MSNITIKTKFNDDTRRFTLADGVDLLQHVADHVAPLYELTPDQIRFWHDGTAVTTSEQLRATNPEGILRLNVTAELCGIEEPAVTAEEPAPTMNAGADDKTSLKVEPISTEEAPAAKEAAPATCLHRTDGIHQKSKHLDPRPGTFQRLVHTPTGQTFDVAGYTLPSGRVCFKVAGQQKNCAIGPKGRLGHAGGEGPWAQFTLIASEEGMCLQNWGNRAKGWGLGAEEGALLMATDAQPVWQLQLADGSTFKPAAPAQWYEGKKVAKAEAKAAKAEAKVMKAEVKALKAEAKKAENAEGTHMLATVVLAGNMDGRDVAVGSSLAVHGSQDSDIFDKNGTFTIVTAENSKASLWRIEQGGWVPPGLVSLSVAGNIDARSCAQDWTLIVSQAAKAPHKRDNGSAYTIATRAGNKKGGLFEIEPHHDDPNKCRLRYVGNRDGRAGAQGWYLAVHGSDKRDSRDDISSYTIVTRDAGKASLWEIKPFWGAVPTPAVKHCELDGCGNPKISFHTAKRAAMPGLHDGLCALLGGPASNAPLVWTEQGIEHIQPFIGYFPWAAVGSPFTAEHLAAIQMRGFPTATNETCVACGTARYASAPTVQAPTAQSAAAAIHSLRVALEWVNKKTGLPIRVDELRNEEALAVVNKLRSLPKDLPTWARKDFGGSIPDDAHLRVDAFIDAMGRRMQALWQEQMDQANQQANATATAPELDMVAEHKAAEWAEMKAAKKAQMKATKEAEKAELKAAKEAEKAAKEAAKAELKVAKEAAKAEEKSKKEAAKAEEKAKKEAAKAAKAEEKAKKEATKALLVAELKTKNATSAAENFKAEAKQWGGHSVVEGTNGWVEYEFTAEAACQAVVAVKFNAKDARPLVLSLNGTQVCSDFASGVSGSWKNSDKLVWGEASVPCAVAAGTNMLRLESEGYFPHLMKLRITAIPEAPNTRRPSIPDLDLAALPAVPKAEVTAVAPEPLPVPEPLPASETAPETAQLLAQLNNMGFATPRANAHALAAANGSLEIAVDLLLTSDYTMLDAEGNECSE